MECGGKYEYAEIFIWEKSNEVFNGTAILRDLGNIEREFTIEKLSGSNKFMFTFKDGTMFGIFQIQNDKIAFLTVDKPGYRKKTMYRTMEETDNDFWAYYNNTKQFYEEYEFRHLKSINNAIKKAFHSGE